MMDSGPRHPQPALTLPIFPIFRWALLRPERIVMTSDEMVHMASKRDAWPGPCEQDTLPPRALSPPDVSSH
jgi:hypothetical protein